MKIRLTLIAALFAVVGVGLLTAAAPQGKIDHAWNLKQVPAHDPKPTDVPTILPDMKGVHPRLLYTEKDIEKLKPLIEKDPLLKEKVAGMITWAKRTKSLRGNPPDIFKTDTPALVTAFRGIPQLGWAYSLTKDPQIKDNIIAILKIALENEHWTASAEVDSSMGAGNCMFMAGFLFDTVCDDMEPAFRLEVAKKLLTHVRRMYYLGLQQKSQQRIKYWQQDPANNHRWHRVCGVSACLLAIADEKGLPANDVNFMLQEYKKEMNFLTKYYPKDGDCHEGAGYQRFGFAYLYLAADMWDRVTGTKYLEHPGFANAWAQQLYYWAPGRNAFMTFGDNPNNNNGMDDLGFAFFCSPKLSRDKNVQAAMKRFYEKTAQYKRGKKMEQRFGWLMLKCYDSNLTGGDYKAVPTYRIFPDLGAASMRDSWEDDAVLFTFKCGPYGGYKLNEYRHEHVKDGKPHYINVAHDDPDANGFALGSNGEFFFHPGNYSTHKMTNQANTLLVDGKGQIQEGDSYTQPTMEADIDMRNLSYLTGWKADKASGRIIVEGEAGPAYKVREKDAEGNLTGKITEKLKRFRRTCIWMPGDYILILDDIIAADDQKHKFAWQAGTHYGQFEKPEDGMCYLKTDKGQRMDFQMLSNKEFNGSIDYLHLGGRWSGILLNQFQFFQNANAIKYACLMDPWKKKPVMTMKEAKDGVVTITVKGKGVNDTWVWKAAKDLKTPSVITGTRNGKPLIALTEKDKAPQGD